MSSITETTIGAYMYTYFVTFPQQANWSYTIKATEEGWMYMTQIWKEAGYTIEKADLKSA